jgi:hypothetical protein
MQNTATAQRNSSLLTTAKKMSKTANIKNKFSRPIHDESYRVVFEMLLCKSIDDGFR